MKVHGFGTGNSEKTKGKDVIDCRREIKGTAKAFIILRGGECVSQLACDCWRVMNLCLITQSGRHGPLFLQSRDPSSLAQWHKALQIELFYS